MALEKLIDYENINSALKFYTQRGYDYVEVPWIVDDYYASVTRPNNAVPFTTKGGTLVGSAEQGFLSIKDELGYDNKFVACTPCFRDEEIDKLHKKWFMKVELFHVFPIQPEKDLEALINDAMDFFNRYTSPRVISTFIGYDIVADILGETVELGSYGIRNNIDLCWIYGTGCAEPRLSQCVQTNFYGEWHG